MRSRGLLLLYYSCYFRPLLLHFLVKSDALHEHVQGWAFVGATLVGVLHEQGVGGVEESLRCGAAFLQSPNKQRDRGAPVYFLTEDAEDALPPREKVHQSCEAF